MAVKYRKNGKRLGVLGGMGPAAAAEFLRQLAAKCPAATDQEHPVVYMIGDAEIPDRGTAIFGKGPSPLPRLQADLLQLCAMGADILVVPCNTAHYFIDQFQEPLPKPLIHIVGSTVLATKAIAPNGAWMLSTKGTRACGLYQKYAAKHGLKLFIPNEEQSDKAQQVIDFVKANKLAEAGIIMRALVEELWRERDVPVMTACTELPLGYDASGLPQERSVSSIGALADAVVRALYDEVEA
ncbi:MAG: amino acid racemase [Phascolarctobacterium sp.]|uniref:aspartate/glutamate racemase family protein n=1 Tax=Phascolarctobacterium sp. TaxID=2049039 RepID=UPI0026DA803E|nr:amino acid racemase [Phascolarctobacterium sp.]MDO4921219.1 amino acid racemase [Phascolarctobacterium sp.]